MIKKINSSARGSRPASTAVIGTEHALKPISIEILSLTFSPCVCVCVLPKEPLVKDFLHSNGFYGFSLKSWLYIEYIKQKEAFFFSLFPFLTRCGHKDVKRSNQKKKGEVKNRVLFFRKTSIILPIHPILSIVELISPKNREDDSKIFKAGLYASNDCHG